MLVDLPGYGYAKVSQAARAAWRPLVESYLGARGVLAGVVLIVDVRRGLEEEEHQLLDFLAALAIPALVLATKIDKLNRSAQTKALRGARRERRAGRAVLGGDRRRRRGGVEDDRGLDARRRSASGARPPARR